MTRVLGLHYVTMIIRSHGSRGKRSSSNFIFLSNRTSCAGGNLFKTVEAYRYFVIVLKLLIENHWILTSPSRQGRTPHQAASEVILRQVARQVVVRVLGEHVREPLLGLGGPAPPPARRPAPRPAPDVLQGALVSVHLVVELVEGGAGGLLGAERVGAELQGLVLVPALLDVVTQGRAPAHQVEDARGDELRARNEIGKSNQI